MKDGPEGDEIFSRLEPKDVGTDGDGDPITSCIVVPVEIGAKPCERKVTGAKKVALDILRDAIDEAGSIPPPSNHIPPHTKTVSFETWRTYAYQASITDSDKSEARQKAFVRAANDLQRAGLIRKWGNHVWVV
jgi:hypothetical protein